MKLRSKWSAFFVLVAVAAGLLFFWPRGGDDRVAKETRARLRAEGFKTDLAEFDFSVSGAAAARGREVLAGDISIGSTLVRDVKSLIVSAAGDLMMTGKHTAVVVWKHQKLGQPAKEPWPAMAVMMEEHREKLDGACNALLAGPFAFPMAATNISARHWPHLPDVARALAARAVVELHDGRRAEAWTNMLAVCRTVTRWNIESVADSHRVRFEMMRTAQAAIWHALQDHGRSEEQLAALENEWTNVNFFEALPKTVAFARASMQADLENYRLQPAPQPDFTFREGLKNPSYIHGYLKARTEDQRYRVRGVFEDQSDMLIYFRDREIELRRAIRAENLAGMLLLPGVMEGPRFVSRHNYSFAPSSIDSGKFSFQTGQFVGLLGHAADAEIRRRLILTAIALERHRMRKGAYPEKLPDDAPVDFGDGKPLRYRTTVDGRFWLYSIGLDGVDNGGDARGSPPRWPRTLRFGVPKGIDIVWPLPQAQEDARSASFSE